MSDATATVIATYSRRMRIRLATGETHDARIKGKKLKPVCGDQVVASKIEGESDWLIVNILGRRNALQRPNSRGAGEVLAANIDTVIVVSSPLPKPDWFVVDRYLCATENMRANGIVVFNKCDLETDDAHLAELRDFEQVGYPVLLTNALENSGFDALLPLLENQTAIIVGQSGVGKSSIINALLGDEQQKTATLSDKHREGRHTTVNSAMIDVGNGAIIDSPGVRDFAPKLDAIEDAAAGFREISAAADSCRFANCRHLREPNCGVKQCVEAGSISARRYESYRRLVNLTQRLADKT